MHILFIYLISIARNEFCDDNYHASKTKNFLIH